MPFDMGPWKPPLLGAYIKNLKHRSSDSLRAELNEIRADINDIEWDRRHGFEYDFMELYVLRNKQILLITTIQELEYDQNKQRESEFYGALNAIHESLTKIEVFLDKSQLSKRRKKVDSKQEGVEHEVVLSMENIENKSEVQAQVLLGHEKSIEEDKPPCEQEGSNDVEIEVSDYQPISESLEKFVIVAEELPLVVQVYKQSILEEFHLIVLATSLQEFKVKVEDKYYEIYPLPSPCKIMWIHCLRLFVMAILPYFKTRGRVFFNKRGMMGTRSCT